MSDEIKLEESSRAAAARARRQKILENSNKRLTKLTGREFNEGEIFIILLSLTIPFHQLAIFNLRYSNPRNHRSAQQAKSNRCRHPISRSRLRARSFRGYNCTQPDDERSRRRARQHERSICISSVDARCRRTKSAFWWCTNERSSTRASCA